MHDFISLAEDVEPMGQLANDKTYAFNFKNVDMPLETYNGRNVRLRYMIRAQIGRQYASNVTKSADFVIQQLQTEPESNTQIKMEVGIEDCLHIEFEYGKSKYHLKDIVLGKIHFLLIKIRIKVLEYIFMFLAHLIDCFSSSFVAQHMELVVIRRETTGTGANAVNDSTNIAKFEIMDGVPFRGEVVPVRLFLAPYDLTPTMKNVHNRFSVRYYLNLVLVDEEDRRYFKQQEIHMWRKEFTSLPPETTVESLSTASN